MQNYRIQINEVNQEVYETFKKVLKENDVPTTGYQSELNEIKNIIFENGLMEFNKNPKRWLKKLQQEK